MRVPALETTHHQQHPVGKRVRQATIPRCSGAEEGLSTSASSKQYANHETGAVYASMR